MLKNLVRENGVRGYLTGVRGDLSGVCGNIDECEITDADRKAGIDINDLIKTN